jgi:hypothetical protein
MKESSEQKRIMLAMSGVGSIVWRNNTGVLKNEEGIPVRFGLCVGSSDIIGITPVMITQEMVGRCVGIFTAVEVKSATGRTKPEQQIFLDAVKKAGGIAGVARSVEDALKLIQ